MSRVCEEKMCVDVSISVPRNLSVDKLVCSYSLKKVGEADRDVSKYN